MSNLRKFSPIEIRWCAIRSLRVAAMESCVIMSFPYAAAFAGNFASFGFWWVAFLIFCLILSAIRSFAFEILILSKTM